MNDARGRRSGFSIGIDVRHHVVTDFLFAAGDTVKVNIGQVCFQVPDLLFGDRQTEFVLRLRQCQPQPAPGLGTPLRRKELLHGDGGVAGNQG